MNVTAHDSFIGPIAHERWDFRAVGSVSSEQGEMLG